MWLAYHHRVVLTCSGAAPPSQPRRLLLNRCWCSTPRVEILGSFGKLETYALLQPLSGVQSAAIWQSCASGLVCMSMLPTALAAGGGVPRSQDPFGDDNGDRSAILFCSCKLLFVRLSKHEAAASQPKTNSIPYVSNASSIFSTFDIQ